MASMNPSDYSHDKSLTEREQLILRSVIDQFVETADPVGSRSVAKRYNIDLSPASIRNTMSDLEDRGYLDHPYTSAGRVPTERGYRRYVDQLMEVDMVPTGDWKKLKVRVDRIQQDIDDVLQESSRLLGKLSNLIGVVISPRLSSAVLERLEIVPLSSQRAMFVISVKSGLFKTIVSEVESELPREKLDRVVRILNERLAGLTLAEIRDSYARRVKDVRDDDTGIVRLVLKNAPELFSELPETRRVSVGGARYIMNQPEFQEPKEVQNVMELLEEERNLARLVEEQPETAAHGKGRARISIGQEIPSEKAAQYSIVAARYNLGESVGTIGVIGPIRMNYPRVVSLVDIAASLLSQSRNDVRESNDVN